MTVKEALGYLAGTLVVAALSVAAIMAVVLAITMIPLLLFIAPMTATAVGVVLLIAWRTRRRRNRER